MTHKGHTENNKPLANWKAIYAECVKHERFIVEVREYDEAKEISLQQMKYMHSVVFKALAEHVGCSELMAELMLKKKCGEQWFVQKVDGNTVILSKTMLTIKQTTKWLENCWEWLESIGCPVPPPDKDWKSNKEGKQ